MQLTPTPDVTAPGRPATGRRGTGPLARLDRPAAAGLIALAGWLAFAAARLAGWAHGQLSLFIGSGTHYSHPALMFPRIAHVQGQGLRRAVLLPVRLRPVQLAPDRGRHHHRPPVPLHPDRVLGGGLAAVRRRPRAGAAAGAGGGQPGLRGRAGLAGSGLRPRRRAACAVGAALRRVLRPGRQRRARHLGTAGRRVPAGRAARLPPRPLPDGGAAGELRRLHQRAGAGAAAVLALLRLWQLGRQRLRPGARGSGRGGWTWSGCCPACCTCCCRSSSGWRCGDPRRRGRRLGQPHLAVHRPGSRP